MSPKRNRPGSASQAAPRSTATDILKCSPDALHSTPTPDERREAALLAELEALGYSISVRCKVCGHPLTTRLSTSLHIGPKCRAKRAVAGW